MISVDVSELAHPAVFLVVVFVNRSIGVVRALVVLSVCPFTVAVVVVVAATGAVAEWDGSTT